MAAYERNTSSPRSQSSHGSFNLPDEEKVPLSDLLRRFGQDAAELVRHEIALAKLELRDTIKTYAQGAGRIGAAAGVGLLGLLALTAFLVVGLGDLIDNYWLSALLIAVVLLAVAGVMARSALAHMRQNSVTAEATVTTLKEDQQWAMREARDFKHKLKT
jgi:uncharacterized membrane protein YqjE